MGFGLDLGRCMGFGPELPSLENKIKKLIIPFEKDGYLHKINQSYMRVSIITFCTN